MRKGILSPDEVIFIETQKPVLIAMTEELLNKIQPSGNLKQTAEEIIASFAAILIVGYRSKEDQNETENKLVRQKTVN